MVKRTLDLNVTKNLVFPYIPVLVGVNVDEKPNYIAIGLIGWLCYDTMAISVGHQQYSRKGLEENRTFSINQPGAKLVRELDYCGMVSGRTTDKASLFETFYGETKTAPMIAECPINLECRVVQTLVRPVHTVFLGEVVAVHASEDCLTGGVPDVSRIEPCSTPPTRARGSRSTATGRWASGSAAPTRSGTRFARSRDEAQSTSSGKRLTHSNLMI